MIHRTAVTFIAAVVLLTSSASVMSMSFDGDTMNGSVLLTRADGQLSWLKNDPVSQIQGVHSFNVSDDGGLTDRPLALAVGDFDGDANGDVIVARSGGNLGFGDGLITWVERFDQPDPATDTLTGVNSFTVTPSNSIAMGEMGDGAFADAIVGRDDGFITWSLNSGIDTITANDSWNAGTPIGVAVGNFDGDNDGDVLIARSDGTLTWAERTNINTFTGVHNFNISPANSIAMGDADNDGDDDVFVGRDDGFVTWAFKATGSDTITSDSSVGSFDAAGVIDLAFGDVGNDGVGDIFVARPDGTILWLQANPGVNNMNAIDTITAAVPAGGTDLTAIDVGNFDGDSDLDIIVGRSEGGGFGGSVGWYEVVGGVLVEEQQFFNVGAPVTDLVLADPEPAAVLLGDANKDGQVTGADLISVQQNFGNVGATPLQGDANNDGQVTGADLISVQQNFGNVASPAAVPEPATIALVLISAVVGSLKRRRL